MDSKSKRGRWIALAAIVGLAMMWAGFGALAAASGPSTITTCTTVRNGKLKVISTAAVAKCTKKGKGVATTWDDHSTVVTLTNQLAASQSQLATSQQETVAAARYHTLMFGSTACGGSTNNFAGMALHDVYMPLCLNGADLSYANLNGAHMENLNLVNANVSHAVLTSPFLSDAFFWNADASSANLSGATLYQAEFTDADLTGANLSGADLHFTKLSGADLTGANLSGANLTGTIWNQTVCPDGTHSDTNGTVPQSCVGHL